MQPLVSVICLCYNHARFLREALDSVLNQTYQNLEIIVVDDLSTDNSREIIEDYVRRFPQIKYLPNAQNLGNCVAFNRAYRLSKGKYLIDFATDDVLMPERIAEQVAAFEKLDESYGILFTDAEFIDDFGNHLLNFYKRDKNGNLAENVPDGDVFAHVIARHYICSPTMIMRRTVFDKLNGYDETLAYEDFDLWVRSAPDFKYFFLDRILTKRRIHAAQMSQQQYKPNDKQIFSTITVCKKAQKLLRTEREKQALKKRVIHELIQAVFTRNFEATRQLYGLLQDLGPVPAKMKMLVAIHKLPFPFERTRQLYQQIRFGK
ncbi:glycosyltransferase [Adhaeribacter sp. BT258]|uniref:Glycosyltransferase n=1 Tax=Adhaeribacter terrigena TaxID=2793070 RepID=A0ABS1BYL9_9BACT|nr:glycosyltransferase [Adhaeribacter terrigena]MBK0402021.1 glycosyltransferase [Adhaeribacter terrigena]